jgi:hypothetical protein
MQQQRSQKTRTGFKKDRIVRIWTVFKKNCIDFVKYCGIMYYVSPLGGGPWTGFKKYDKFCIEIVFVGSFIGSWRVSEVCRVPLRAKRA